MHFTVFFKNELVNLFVTFIARDLLGVFYQSMSLKFLPRLKGPVANVTLILWRCVHVVCVTIEVPLVPEGFTTEGTRVLSSVNQMDVLDMTQGIFVRLRNNVATLASPSMLDGKSGRWR